MGIHCCTFFLTLGAVEDAKCSGPARRGGGGLFLLALGAVGAVGVSSATCPPPSCHGHATQNAAQTPSKRHSNATSVCTRPCAEAMDEPTKSQIKPTKPSRPPPPSPATHPCAEAMDEPPKRLLSAAQAAGLAADDFITLQHGAMLRTAGGRTLNQPAELGR